MYRFTSCFILCSAVIGNAQQTLPSFDKKIRPLLASYCTDCHGGSTPEADLKLSGSRTLEQFAHERDQWFRVLDQLESGAMPPEDEDQPTNAERAALVKWIRGELAPSLLARQNTVGRAGFRRLTRAEYANTIEDLFGYIPRVGQHLPTDGTADGYQKVPAALPLSSEASLGYVDLAGAALDPILKPIPRDYEREFRAIAVDSGQSKGQNVHLADGTVVSFNSNLESGRVKGNPTKVSGLHRFRISAYGYQTDKPLPVGIYVGNTNAYPQQVSLAAVVEVPPGKAAVVETDVMLSAGQGFRLVPFGLGVPVPKNSMGDKCKAPGLALQWVDITAPELPLPGEAWLTADLPAELTEQIRTNARTAISGKPDTLDGDEFIALVEKTYRRVAPSFLRRLPTDEELAAMRTNAKGMIDEGAPLEKIFKAPLFELMISPDFLCVIEAPGPLDDFAVAGRLARFLWNSTPDETLLQLAAAKKLRDPAVLAAQTERLLADPKSNRFLHDFADQWLRLGAIDETTPDSKLHPDYDDWVKFSSVGETRLFLRHLLDSKLPISSLIDPGFSFLNSALASHYGLPPLDHIDLRKTALPKDSPYGGIWTHSSVSKITANGTNTSPVKRGVWVSERLLGIRIPPPPPEVSPIEPDTRGATTLREQLALHSDSKSCAACHANFDPYGFALESFDVAGSFRSSYRLLDAGGKAITGAEVDPTGVTPDGQTFADIRGLRSHLSESPEALAQGLVRHLITYATGAPPSRLDQPAVDKILYRTAKHQHCFRSLIHLTIQSDIFLRK